MAAQTKDNAGTAMVSRSIAYRALSQPSRCDASGSPLATVLLELPVSVVEWADLTSLEPARDAVEVEGVLVYG